VIFVPVNAAYESIRMVSKLLMRRGILKIIPYNTVRLSVLNLYNSLASTDLSLNSGERNFLFNISPSPNRH